MFHRVSVPEKVWEDNNMKLNEKSVSRVHEIINEYRQFKTPLMMILSKVQNEFGYIPLEVQEIISKELDIPVATIYGVVTFYSSFWF